MTSEGHIVLFRFPQTDQQVGKLRPALVIRKLPGQYNDWLICMISSQLDHRLHDLDEIINSDDSDFPGSGLKVPSLIRVCRLAVVNGDILIGKIGQISNSRLFHIKQNLSQWIQGV